MIDPAVSGLTSVLGARTAWRFEAVGGPSLRRMVLVDATNGRLLADQDLIASLDRVVCDNANVRVDEPSPCTAGFARVEGQPSTGLSDVDDAYDLGGATSGFYDAIGGPDLTELLGLDVGGTKRLASTVRFCYLDAQQPCPYENAFWNGDQMVFGEGFAQADDVVAHELTHGVTEKTANLLYWGQSGAINESMSDVMGEIVDRRHVTAADDPSDWSIGEDLDIGAARDMADPTRFDHPDRMTSDLWFADLGNPPYQDQGGVHLNSGVGNKTFFLISQGGSFNGRTVTGLDAGDTSLTQSATLYLAVLQSLLSGSDYADLGNVLVQTCDDFVAASADGFTADDCQQVRSAVAATELDQTPTNAPQPADAPDTCPAGTTKRTLLDSETGTPTTTFVAGALWTRDPELVPPNATSGTESWFGLDPLPSAGDPYASSLTARTPVTVPSGQKSYLHFQQWRVFEWDPASGLG
ncbi:M4 family metallopeptidase [Mumia sp. DW29H23]|uniref:M4 family metallopeptidase n=1 Tax=Mumia sp. DW29H23 TaxID=3421241 RepID=UPI003D697192